MYRFFLMLFRPLLKLFSFVLRPITGNFAAPYRAKQPDKIRLNAALISDIHIDNRPERIRKLHNGLRDIEKSRTPNNVLVSVGDTTDADTLAQWQLASRIFSAHKPAERSLLVLGNHDRRRNPDGSNNYREKFFDYSRIISGRELSHTWFSEEINGYTFISLAQEDNDLVTAEQLKWFGEQLELASKKKLPIFVFMHESLNVSHGLPYTWERRWDGTRLPDIFRSGIGEDSDTIEAMMKEYENVFFFSGHIHLGLTGKKQLHRFGYSSFETDGSLHRINVPCFMFPNHHGLKTSGIGYQLEVYDDRVLIRPRSYVSSLWYSRYDREYMLK